VLVISSANKKTVTKKRRVRRSITKTVLNRLFWQVLLFSLIYWLGLYFIDYALNGLLADMVDALLGAGVYRSVNTAFVMVSIYVVVIGVFVYRAVYKAGSYADLLAKSIDTILDEHISVPEMPREISDIGLRLQEIKYTMAYNANLSKEAEQRKNDLVVYLAHDLKTPLTSIIGYLSLLEESPDLSIEQRAKYVSITLDKAYRLEQLINEFFDITRFNLQSVALDKNRIDLSLMLCQMVDEFYPIMKENGLEACLEVEPDIIMIGDADKLARVFDNLLRNAISYSYPDTVVEISAWAVDDAVRISFKNKGDEIPPEKVERLFEKFFRLDSTRRTRTGGAGLGLAIAKQIVAMHKGEIAVKSDSEATEFIVVLPLNIPSSLSKE